MNLIYKDEAVRRVRDVKSGVDGFVCVCEETMPLILKVVFRQLAGVIDCFMYRKSILAAKICGHLQIVLSWNARWRSYCLKSKA